MSSSWGQTRGQQERKRRVFIQVEAKAEKQETEEKDKGKKLMRVPEMIEVTGFLLKHLYELMADDYNARYSPESYQQHQSQQYFNARTQYANNSSSSDEVSDLSLANSQNESQSSSLLSDSDSASSLSSFIEEYDDDDDDDCDQDSDSDFDHDHDDDQTFTTNLSDQNPNDDRLALTSGCQDQNNEEIRSQKSMSSSASSLVSLTSGVGSSDSLASRKTSDCSSSRSSLSQQKQNNQNKRHNHYHNHHLKLAKIKQTNATRRKGNSITNHTNNQQFEINSEQATNHQIVSFLTNNHLPDLICETFIETLFICVFLTITWIFVMIIQLHCQQLQQPAKLFYCNTKFLASLMYCNNKSQLVSMWSFPWILYPLTCTN